MGVKGGHTPAPTQPQTYTEIFEEHFPTYLSIGMSYEEYWEGDNNLPSLYRKAHEISKNRLNAEQWRMGMYTHNALMSAMSTLAEKGKYIPYIDQPFPMTEQEAEEQAERREEAKRREQYERLRADLLGRN